MQLFTELTVTYLPYKVDTIIPFFFVVMEMGLILRPLTQWSKYLTTFPNTSANVKTINFLYSIWLALQSAGN